METRRQDEEPEAPRSMLLILAEIQERDEADEPTGESALEELNNRFHAFMTHLREESFRRDQSVAGTFTFTLDASVLKSAATVAHRVEVKLPKPPRAKPRAMFATKGGNLVADKPTQQELQYRDGNEPAAKAVGQKGI